MKHITIIDRAGMENDLMNKRKVRKYFFCDVDIEIQYLLLSPRFRNLKVFEISLLF